MQAIKCDSLNISYDIHGVATISMQIFGDSDNLDRSDIPTTFGNVKFNVIGLSFTTKQVDSSGVYQFDIVLTGIGESQS